MYASYGASWRVRGDHWPLTTPRQPLSSFYIAERAAPAEAFWLSLLSFRFRFVSLFRDASRLCRDSASLCRRSGPFSAGAQFSSLIRFCLISASATPLARSVALYICISRQYEARTAIKALRRNHSPSET